MKLEMTTDFLYLIDPGLTNTRLGECLKAISEEHAGDFKKAIVDCGIATINEFLSIDSVKRILGECTAENGELNSRDSGVYRYRAQFIKFDLNMPDMTAEIIRGTTFTDKFLNWAKDNYASLDGFYWSCSSIRQEFEDALKADDYRFSRAMSVLFLKAIYASMTKEEVHAKQQEFEDAVIEVATSNGWFASSKENTQHD